MTAQPGHGLDEFIARLRAIDGSVARVTANGAAPFASRAPAPPASGTSDETEKLIREVAQDVVVSELAHRGL